MNPSLGIRNFREAAALYIVRSSCTRVYSYTILGCHRFPMAGHMVPFDQGIEVPRTAREFMEINRQ